MASRKTIEPTPAPVTSALVRPAVGALVLSLSGLGCASKPPPPMPPPPMPPPVEDVEEVETAEPSDAPMAEPVEEAPMAEPVEDAPMPPPPDE